MPNNSVVRWPSVVLVTLVALIAAACGSSDDGSGSSASASGASASASEPVATDASAGTEPDGEPGGETGGDDGPISSYVVEHPAGVTEVPADVERILAIDENAAFLLWELGIDPAVIYGSFFTRATPMIAEPLGIEVVPHNIEAPAIEASIAFAPDLAIGTDHPGSMAAYDLWSEVAPTVLFAFDGEWDTELRRVATAFGAEDRAEDRIAALDAEIERVAAAIADAYETPPSVSVVGSLAGMPFAPDAANTAVADLIDRLGLDRPAAQLEEPDPDFGFVFFSAETIGAHDADVVFHLSGGIYQDMTELPSWSGITGESAAVEGEFWLSNHPFGVAWMLQDIEAVLLGQGSVELLDGTLARWDAYNN